MDKETLGALCNLLMVTDPWPDVLSEEDEKLLKKWADEEAQRHGFNDWVDAYHNLENRTIGKCSVPM